MNSGFRIFRSLDEVPAGFGPSAVSIGNFDGLHSGHRAILRRVSEVARENGWNPSVLTFDPHPAKVVAPERAPRLMTTPDQRCDLMREEGITQVLILPFNQEVAHFTPERFVKEILVGRLGVRAAFVGGNFRFGYQQAGDVTVLARLGEQFGFSTEVTHAVSLRGQMVSSSVIRRLTEAGRVELASRMLERPFFLEGKVGPGHGIGSKQTVPTLNLVEYGEILPAVGVYMTETRDLDRNRLWPSVTNVGFRPTFGGSNLSVETHLLEPLAPPSPERIRISFLRHLREEKRFDSPQELKAQILHDAERARAYFRRLKRWVGGRTSSTSS